jgi:hypothetical protein
LTATATATVDDITDRPRAAARFDSEDLVWQGLAKDVAVAVNVNVNVNVNDNDNDGERET